MIVKINDFEFDDEIFLFMIIGREYKLVNFIFKPFWCYEISFVIMFDTLEETLKFHDGYYSALRSGEKRFKYTGNAHFDRKLYERFQEGIKADGEIYRRTKDKQK